MQNGFVEPFNGRLRDERLNEPSFMSLTAVKHIVAACQLDYTTYCRAAGLAGCRPPRTLAVTIRVERERNSSAARNHGAGTIHRNSPLMGKDDNPERRLFGSSRPPFEVTRR